MTRKEREDAKDIIQSILDKYEEDECLVTEITIGDEDIKAFKMAIKALEQGPKVGHWKAFIHDAYHGTDEDSEPVWREKTVYHCSQCNRRTVIKEKFCPNCGAKMVEPPESEDNK